MPIFVVMVVKSHRSHNYHTHNDAYGHYVPTVPWANVTTTSPRADWTLAVGDIIERTCPSCAASHQKIVYKRLTNPGTIDFKTLFLDQVIRRVERITYVYITTYQWMHAFVINITINDRIQVAFQTSGRQQLPKQRLCTVRSR